MLWFSLAALVLRLLPFPSKLEFDWLAGLRLFSCAVFSLVPGQSDTPDTTTTCADFANFCLDLFFFVLLWMGFCGGREGREDDDEEEDEEETI